MKRWAPVRSFGSLALAASLGMGCQNSASAPSDAGGAETDDGDESGESQGSGETGNGDPACEEFQPKDWPDPLLHRGRAEGDTFIEILDVSADGDLVYSCTGTQGLTIWDVSNPSDALLLVENVGPSGLANLAYPRCQHFAKHASASIAAITSRGDEIQPTPFLWTYDISDPEDPVEGIGWSGEASIEGVVFAGDRIVAAAHDDGILIFEDKGGTELEQVGGFADAESDAWLPALHGDVLVVAEGATGLRTYDLAADDPTPLGTLALAGSSKDVVIEGDRAYVASSSRVAVVDIADPANPTLLGETSTVGTALGIALGSDDTVFTAEWDEIRGYDISDPANIRQTVAQAVPVQVASSFTRVLAIDAQPQTGLVFAGEWHGMHSFEHDPGGPNPEVWANPQHLNFGQTEPGDTDDRVIVLRNQGDAPLTVSDVVSSNPDYEVETRCFEIPPFGSTAIEISFSPQAETQSSDTLVFVTDDPDEQSFGVDVVGRVPGLGVGDPAPELALFDLDGKEWTNADFDGNVTLLSYFATF